MLFHFRSSGSHDGGVQADVFLWLASQGDGLRECFSLVQAVQVKGVALPLWCCHVDDAAFGYFLVVVKNGTAALCREQHEFHWLVGSNSDSQLHGSLPPLHGTDVSAQTVLEVGVGTLIL